MAKQLTAQQVANKKQDAKRASKPQYLWRMNSDQAALLEQLSQHYGSKSAALGMALDELKKQLQQK